MPRRHDYEELSPRALARLRSSPRAYVPTELDLGEEGGGRGRQWGGRRAVVERRAPVLPDGFGPPGGRHERARMPGRWVRLPTALAGARWQPGRAAVAGVVVVALLAVAVFGLRVAWARSAGGGTVIAPGGGSRAGPSGVTAGSAPVGVQPGAPGSASGSASPAAAGAGTSPPGGTTAGAGVVVVHVVGEVRRPGVLRLAVGSRVSDAVRAAGGATKGADLARVNLARILVDGEQVRVPAPGEPLEPAGVGGTPGSPGTSGTPGSGLGPGGGLVSLNTADLAALDTLPGVGPVLAQRILDWRTAHGRFTSVDELGEVSGIGEKLLAQLSPLVTL